MRVYRNGVEKKGAVVEYGDDKKPAFVTVDGVRQLASSFTFQDEPAKTKQKRTAPKSRKKSSK